MGPGVRRRSGNTHYWSSIDRHDDWDALWQGHPAVRPRINQTITGDPAMWPIGCLRSVIPDRLPLCRAISLGCGVGNLERSLVELDLATTVLGIDESPEAIAEAGARSAAAGFETRLAYRVADADAALSEQRDLDAVFFHASLHHMARVDEVMERAFQALRPGGIVYLDEYIGPSRNEWTLWHLARLNLAYRRLPRAARRVGIVRAPVSAEDPTEALESSRIPSALARRFHVLFRRDYGGNLLFVIYPNLRRPGEALDAAVRQLMRAEDALRRKGRPGFFGVMIGEKR